MLPLRAAFIVVSAALPAAAGASSARPVGRAAYNYSWRAGYLASGDDITSGSYTVAEAVAVCDGLPACEGFTYESPSQSPPALNVYFKSAVNFVASDSWSAWVATSDPGPPDVNATVAGMKLSLRAGAHTVASLGLVDDPMPPYNFSFVPPLSAFNRPDRSTGGCHGLGDITLRVQPLNSTNASAWAMYGTAYAVATRAATPLPGPWPAGVIALDDVTPLLNATPTGSRVRPDIPLGLTAVRSYEAGVDAVTGAPFLLLRVNLTSAGGVRIGGFGFSLPADDNTNQALAQIAATNTFIDPHIGSGHAFAEWVRVVGNASLIVTPGPSYFQAAAGGAWAPAGRTRMEAWRPLLEDCHFNGAMSEWTVLSTGWAAEWDDNRQAPVLEMPADLRSTGVWGPNPQSPWPSWHGNETLVLPGMRARYWNTPTALVLLAGQSASYSLRFDLTPNGPRSRDGALAATGTAVLSAVPGYVIATDMTSAALFVLPPRGATLATRSVEPSGVLELGTPAAAGADGRVRIPVTALARGRARVILTFTDGTDAVAHYHALPPFPSLIAAAGTHWANASWLPRDYPDPFGRGASVMPWDRERGEWVLDDSRAYIVGLSDDAGAAQNLGAAMKVAWAPTPAEVARKDEYVSNTLYGVKPDTAKAPLRSLQGRAGIDPPADADRVRMTMYYYCAAIDSGGSCTTSGHWAYAYPEQDKCHMPVGGPIWCMVESMADQTYRGYNVPHQLGTWYALYRVARFYPRIATASPWTWYLERAAQLAINLGSPDVGLMDGTLFREVLDALTTEGAANATIRAWATSLEGNMRSRAEGWSRADFPYGSEFNFDTTGQEEVFVWLSRYNYSDAANRTLSAVLAYSSALPNWAYAGGSRSMGDLGNNGKWFVNRGTERLLQHYRAGLNAIVTAEAYQANPDDTLLLDVSIGAQGGQLANIDADGAVSMGFHSYPFVLEFDPRSGDYGLGFTGHTLEVASVLVADTGSGPAFPWRCYFCNLDTAAAPSPAIAAYTLADSYRVRTYLEPLGLLLTALCGTLDAVSVDLTRRTANVTFAAYAGPDAAPYASLYLRVDKKAPGRRPGDAFAVAAADGTPCPLVRGAFEIVPAGAGAAPTRVVLTWTA